MSAYKDQRSGRWRYRKRITKPCGKRGRVEGTPATNTKKAAEAAERDHVLREMNPPAAPANTEKEVPTLNEYTDIFLAHYAAGKPSDVDAKSQILKAYLAPKFGKRKLGSIIQQDVDDLVIALLKRPLDPKTINNILSVLSSMLRLAQRNKLIRSVDAVFFIKSPEYELVSVSPDDIERLLAIACPRYRAAILLASDAGLRAGEMRSVRWTDINDLRTENGEITVRRSIDPKGRLTSTKNWKPRDIPISDRLHDALAALPQWGETIITLKHCEKPLSYWGARDGLVGLYKRASVTKPPKPWHCLRHSFCTSLADAGVPIHVLKELAGHASIATTLRYMHTNAEARSNAIRMAFGRQVGDSRIPNNKKPRKVE